MSAPVGAERRNVVPGAYRGVAVASVECELDEAGLRQHFIGLDAYRRTRFIVVRRDGRTAIAAVRKHSDEPLFSPITSLRLLVGAADCAFVEAPEVDTAVPTALANVAVERVPGQRGVVVQGRYGHVSFIIDPSRLRVTVRETVPPHPAKLYDQARRVLALSEDLPPIELVPDVVELGELALAHPSTGYLLPCRGGGVAVEGATIDYLDEHPRPRSWTLIGCERSQLIHEWFYGERAVQVDICPRRRSGGTGAVLTKCCLLEDHVESEGGRAVVPWGASLAQIAEALAALADAWEPTWQPA